MAEGQDYGYDQPSDKGNSAVITGEPPAYSQPPAAGYPYPGGYAAFPPPVSQQPNTQQSHTTVIVQQPMNMNRGPRVWSSGLCDCFNDMGVCLCGWFCGCCLASSVASDMGESSCAPCCVPGWLIALRMKMRMQEKIPGTLMDDCCVTACCGPCVLCQLAREIKHVKLVQAQTGQHGQAF